MDDEKRGQLQKDVGFHGIGDSFLVEMSTWGAGVVQESRETAWVYRDKSQRAGSENRTAD